MHPKQGARISTGRQCPPTCPSGRAATDQPAVPLSLLSTNRRPLRYVPKHHLYLQRIHWPTSKEGLAVLQEDILPLTSELMAGSQRRARLLLGHHHPSGRPPRVGCRRTIGDPGILCPRSLLTHILTPGLRRPLRPRRLSPTVSATWIALTATSIIGHGERQTERTRTLPSRTALSHQRAEAVWLIFSTPPTLPSRRTKMIPEKTTGRGRDFSNCREEPDLGYGSRRLFILDFIGRAYTITEVVCLMRNIESLGYDSTNGTPGFHNKFYGRH